MVAGAPRKPEAFGLPLVYKGVHAGIQTVEGLKKVKQHYPSIGQSMTKTVFLGGTREVDASWWEEAKAALEKTKNGE